MSAVMSDPPFVQSVCQDAYGGESLVEGCPVGVHVDAVGEAADDEHIGTGFPQVMHEAAAEVLAVGGYLTCAHHADDVGGVEVGRAEIVEQDGSVGAVAQPLGIGLVVQSEGSDVVLLAELPLLLGPRQVAVHRGQRVERVLRRRRQHFAHPLAVLVDGCGGAHLLDEDMEARQVEGWHAGQRHHVERLLFSHSAA